jgi:phosphoribosyl-ATP pyrophosphohydrolase/phosphoribosyl-AMP cyclohydrolase
MKENKEVEKKTSAALSKKFNFKELKLDANGLIPAIIQDYRDGTVLMLGYMNPESLKRTIKSGRTCFWSRSRQEFWVKGLTSGHFQLVKSIAYDCDVDALLVKVRQVGDIACHTGKRSCFYRRIKPNFAIANLT